jgi:hypothetical protein
LDGQRMGGNRAGERDRSDTRQEHRGNDFHGLSPWSRWVKTRPKIYRRGAGRGI